MKHEVISTPSTENVLRMMFECKTFDAQNEEKTPLNSRLTYAVVKNIGESFCKAYFKEYKINYTIFRFFNTYGPKQSNDFVISKFLKQALSNKNITIYGSGNQSRTFCYIDDTTQAIINCFTKRLFINDTVNIGNNKVVNSFLKNFADSGIR